MASNDVSSDADMLAEFWTEWAGNTKYLNLIVSEFVGQQERLVRQVFERCPGGDYRNHLVSGRACGEPPLFAQASLATDASLACICVDLDEGKGQRGGETLTAATCLETGGASLHTASAGGSLKRSDESCVSPLQAPSCAEPSGSQAAEVTQLEPSAWTGGSPEKTNRRIPRVSSKYDQLKAFRKQRTDKDKQECEAVDAWQSRYDELMTRAARHRRADRALSMVGILPTRMLHLLQFWYQLEEPPRRGCIRNLIGHTWFQYCTGLFILMNTGFAVYLSDYGIRHVGVQAPNETAVEGAFLMLFALEMCLKIWVHRVYFFCNDEMTWNIFDFVLVLISITDVSTTLAARSSSSGGSINLTFARSCRIFKAVRILRMFRAVKFLKSLRVILVSIVQSFSTFVWSVTVMFMICFTFSLLFVQQIGGFTSDALHDGQVNGELWAAQQHYFGSVTRGTFTLLMVAMGGSDWSLVHNLIEPLGPGFNAAFVLFLIFFQFALMNVLAGMFLDTVVQMSKPDNEEQITETWMQEAHDLADLHRIVEAMDDERSGAITNEAFVKCCSYPHINLCFAKLGIDVGHPEDFFSAAADGAERVSVEDFVAGAVHMKGFVTNAEVQRVVIDVRSLHQLISKIPVYTL